MLLVGNNMDLIKEVKHHLFSKLYMKDLRIAHFILEMKIRRDRTNKNIWLSQHKYVEGILKRFNIQDNKSVKVPIPVGTRLSVE